MKRESTPRSPIREVAGSQIRKNGLRLAKPTANRWMNNDSFNRVRGFGLRHFLVSEVPLITFATITIMLDLMDIANFYHWIPELITFFLLGRCYFRIGMRAFVILTASVFIIGCGGFYLIVYGTLYSMLLVAGFSVAFYAGYQRRRIIETR